MTSIKFNRTDKIILISVLSVILVIIGILSSFADSKEEIHYEKYVVREGDTLWKLAIKINPEMNPRSIVELIKEKNELNSSMIYVGQILLIPSYERSNKKVNQNPPNTNALSND